MDLILSKVKLIPTKDIEKYKEESYGIVKNIDEKDLLFVACALSYKDSAIWSNDSNLKTKQSKIKVINTKEAIDILN